MLAAELSLSVISPKRDHVGGKVLAVVTGCPAARAGVLAGDLITSLDGQPLIDEIDLKFRQDRALIRLGVERDGTVRVLTVRKQPYEDLGIEFEDGLFDGVRECNNRCSFCFLKGLPGGLRRSLYFKDDDYRLSFLYGNFVTLTNLSAADWDRIAEQHLSPLYFSVHATDTAVRRRLLGNPSAPDVLTQLDWLAKHDIQVHTQLVVTPGVNDGAILQQSIDDLASRFPTVQSIGVVPVGVSRRGAFRPLARVELEERLQRKGVRPSLTTLSEARDIVRMVRPRQRLYRAEYGIDLVYLADEYYLRAGLPVPAAARYDGYPQFQNGIGLVRDLKEQVRNLKRRPIRLAKPVHLTAVCGELAAPNLSAALDEVMETVAGLTVQLVVVHNQFFGESITASGLLTLPDLREALAGRAIGDALVLPRVMLDSTGVRFLDGGTPEALSAEVGAQVRAAGTLRELVNVAQEVARER